MKNLLRIVRWPNLLMLAAIQLLIYWKLIDHGRTVMERLELLLLVAVTVLSGAAGYVINDYYDQEIDAVNKPGHRIAGDAWSPRLVIYVYAIILLVGAGLSLWLADRLNLLKFIWIYPLVTGGLWWYSAKLKCTPVAGNLWVSLFCAGVIISVSLADLLHETKEAVFSTLWIYTGFAFLATWMREVVKDMEDEEVDKRMHCRSTAVVLGSLWSRVLVAFLGVSLIAGIYFWEMQVVSITAKTIMLILQGSVLGAIALTLWSKGKRDYHYASSLLKFTMIGGTFILLL